MKFRTLSKSILATSILAVALPFCAVAGTFSSTPLTGDADSGISADKSYTHAINVFDNSNLTINGVVFTGSGGGANPFTNNYSTGGLGNGFTANNAGLGGSVNGLFTNFLYNGNPETVTLNNLRVGQQYVTTFYNAAFGPAGGRVTDVSTSDGGFITFDQNGQPGSLLQYSFTALAPTQSFSFLPHVPGDTWHQYAFSNQVLGQKALFTDNFYAPSNPNTNDLNFNLAARQGGSLVSLGGPITYTSAGNNQVGNTTGNIDSGNYLLDAFGGTAAIDHNFSGIESAGGLSIAFDFAPNSTANGDTTVWEAINLGLSGANRNAGVNSAATHFGILFRGNGLIQAFDGNTVVSADQPWGAGATNQLNHIEMLITDPSDSNPFDGVGQTNIGVYANGSLVYSYSKGGGGYAENFVNFQSTAIGGADNVVISQGVPEPGSAMLLLSGLAFVGMRRRRA